MDRSEEGSAESPREEPPENPEAGAVDPRDDKVGQAVGHDSSAPEEPADAPAAESADAKDDESAGAEDGSLGEGAAGSEGDQEPSEEAVKAAGEGDGPSGEDGAAGAGNGRRRRRVKKILAWTGGTLAVLLALAGGGIYWLYAHLDGNIKHEKADSSTLGKSRPVKLNSSTNILLMGIDSRAGTGGAYGVDAGEDNSDTMILLHISPNGDHAVGISFPRDSMVNVPSCKEKSGGQSKPYFGMINSAVAVGGPLCTWKTIEANTGIHIDHFVLVDFNGFKRVVNALGGVEICLPQPVDDPRANLDLPAGKQVVKGDAALAYVRERYALGDGSDLGRIKRQQKFMSSVVKKALSSDMLTNPIQEYQFLDAATKSITVDDGLTISKMRSLASSLKGITSGKVQFVTVPNHPYPADPNRVQWDADASKAIFEAISRDNNLPAAPTAPPTPAEPQLPADQVKISVLQDTKAKAQASAAQLAAKGFPVADEGTTKATVTQITYGPGAGTRASALANTIGNLNPVEDPKAPKGTITLIVGSQGLTFIPPPAATPTPPPVTGGATADQNLCGPNDD